MSPDVECPDRRRILGAGLAAGAFAGISGLPGLAFAQIPTDRRLVVVILRGGLDGLAALPPYADPAYRARRGGLALPEPGPAAAPAGAVLDLGGGFGLHPALRDLQPWFAAGEAVAFHAVATPYRARSHFDGQDLLETAMTHPKAADDGWLNRALSLYPARDGARLGRALANTVPMILSGQAPVTSWSPAMTPPDDDLLARMDRLYAHDPAFHSALNQAMATQQFAERQGLENAGSRRRRARASLGASVDAVAGFLTATDGPRVAVMSVDGWDTHARQGALDGLLARRLADLGAGLDRLGRAMAPVWNRTVVAVITEFGRTVAVNGTGGTDHGTGGVALLMGGALRGGRAACERVISDWPGLDAGRLYQGRDLAPTTDLRAVLKAVLNSHLELPRADIEARIFPGSRPVAPIRGLFA